ncbi:MAG: alpha/beta hydrolase [Roseiflexaceae bacterium]
MNYLMTFFGVVLLLVGVLLILWFTNLGGIKERLLVNVAVNMRVSPSRMNNPKTPSDYGMQYTNVDVMTPDGIRLSAWLMTPDITRNRTIIINHALTTTRYGAVDGLDDVPVEYLPMVKHLYDAGYSILFYDHRGQGESDGGLGRNMIGQAAPVGAGMTEWQDVIGSLNYVQNHPDLKNDEIAFVAHCMGANALFLAWDKEPTLFNNANITSIIALQPTISEKMFGRFLINMLGVDIAAAVGEKQLNEYGFGYATTHEYVRSISVPVLYLQVKKDKYTFDQVTGKNDIETIIAATPTEKEVIWVGTEEVRPFGNNQRFDGYAYFNKYPEEMLSFLTKNFTK